jgi:PDZ domain
MRRLGLLTLCLFCAATVAAQNPSGPPADEKGTFLGVLFSPVPEALYDQLPHLPRNQGVLVTHVLPDSPASTADLHRNDILLQYQDEKIRDCEHFARLIQADRPNHKVKLALMRGGKETTVEVTLALGPMLRIASATRTHLLGTEVPRGVAKPGASASVSVAATPLSQGKMKVAIEYYQAGTGRLRTVTCEGAPAVIDDEVLKLPERERTLVQAALLRIRSLTAQKDENKVEAPKDR